MDKLMKKTVGELMTAKVISVTETDGLKKVFELMEKHGILGLPVVDEGNRVVGIVTQSDLIRRMASLQPPAAFPLLGSIVYFQSPEHFNQSLKEHLARTAGEVMVRDVATIGQENTLKQAIDLMAARKVNRLPVLDAKGKLSGILTRTDLVGHLARLNAA